MPKKAVYNSYTIPKGISQQSDSQVFTKVEIEKAKNFRYKQNNSFISIEAFKSLGTSNSTIGKKIINLERYKDTLLAFTPDEIYRLDQFNAIDGNHEFTKVGDYLNADVNTIPISQTGVNFYYPAMSIYRGFAYIAYTNGTEITLLKYNLQNDIIVDRKTFTQTYTHLGIRIDRTELIEDSKRVILYGLSSTTAASGRQIFPYNDVPTNWIRVTYPKAITTTQTVATAGTKTYHNLREWGSFTYNSKNYKVIYSKNDAYFIVNDAGVAVCKIGSRTGPSFDNRFLLDSEAIHIEDDTIYIPCLLSTKEVSLKDPSLVAVGQEDLNNLLFFPVGLSIIQLKVDRKFKKVNTIEYSSGLMLSGPIIQHYDGNKFNEFGFSEELNDFTISTQFTNTKTIEARMRYTSGDTKIYSVSGARQQDAALRGILRSDAPAPIFTGISSGSRNPGTFLGQSATRDLSIGFTRNNAGIGVRLVYDTGEIPPNALSASVLGRSGGNFSGVWIINDGTNVSGIYGYSSTDRRVINAYIDYDFEVELYSNFPVGYGEDVFSFYRLTTPVSASDLTGLNEILSFSNIGTTTSRLSLNSNQSDYSVRVEDLGSTLNQLRVIVTNHLDASPPMPRDLFNQMSIATGGDTNNFPLGASTVLDNTRIYLVTRGTFSITKGLSYTIQLRSQLGEGWFTESIQSQVDSISEGTTALPNITGIEILPISVTGSTFIGPQVKLNYDQAGDSIGTNRLVLEVKSGSQSLIYSNRANSGNNITFTNNNNIISDLSTDDKTSDIPIELVISDVTIAEQNLLTQPENIYQYAGYFKWTDTLGKEHLSGLSFQKIKSVFGLIGEPISAGISEKIAVTLVFNNLNLTNKSNVAFVLLRARRPNSFYKIVTEQKINSTDETITVVDDKLEREIYGTIVVNTFRRIYQPPGARFIAIGRRNRIFLGNVIGYDDAVFYSNSISNESVTNFAFLRHDPTIPTSDSGRIFMDNRILALSNLDTNLTIFTSRAIFYITVENLQPQLIQESLSNYATQSEAVIPFSRGVCFVNNKGIQYVSRAFKVHWISKDIIKILEGFYIGNIRDLKVKIVSAYVSDNDREIRFRVVNADNVPIGNIVYNTGYELWTMEDDLNGAEQEIKGSRFVIKDDRELYISRSVNDLEIDPIRRDREFAFETGWINFVTPAKAVLLTHIDFIGDFGKHTDFKVDVFYDYKEEAVPEYSHQIKSYAQRKLENPNTRTNSVIRIQSQKQKIFSFKLKVSIISDNVKLSALGFLTRQQINTQPHIVG